MPRRGPVASINEKAVSDEFERHDWTRLNPRQVGRYAEYLAKMEFALWGFDVYSAEVDDKGIDFVIRAGEDSFFDVQVKSARPKRKSAYIFFPKSKFALRPTLLAALVLLRDRQPPEMFLIPSTAWLQPNALFVDRLYGKPDQKSAPEWGINLSGKTEVLLEPYAFETQVSIISATAETREGRSTPP